MRVSQCALLLLLLAVTPSSTSAASGKQFLRQDKEKDAAKYEVTHEEKSYWERLMQQTGSMSVAPQPSPRPPPVDPPTPSPVDPTPSPVDPTPSPVNPTPTPIDPTPPPVTPAPVDEPTEAPPTLPEDPTEAPPTLAEDPTEAPPTESPPTDTPPTSDPIVPTAAPTPVTQPTGDLELCSESIQAIVNCVAEQCPEETVAGQCDVREVADNCEDVEDICQEVSACCDNDCVSQIEAVIDNCIPGDICEDISCSGLTPGLTPEPTTCDENSDCLSDLADYCFKVNPTVSGVCTCNPDTGFGCDGDFTCTFPLGLVGAPPDCYLPVNSECDEDSECVTGECFKDSPTSSGICACNPDTGFGCDGCDGLSCEGCLNAPCAWAPEAGCLTSCDVIADTACFPSEDYTAIEVCPTFAPPPTAPEPTQEPLAPTSAPMSSGDCCVVLQECVDQCSDFVCIGVCETNTQFACTTESCGIEFQGCCANLKKCLDDCGTNFICQNTCPLMTGIQFQCNKSSCGL